MSLTAADLDDIRALARNKHLPWGKPDGWEMVAMDLLGEVDRLRAGIRGGLNESRSMQAEVRSSVTLAYLQSVLEELLNPTEGDQS